jgi:hypothetical protein
VFPGRSAAETFNWLKVLTIGMMGNRSKGLAGSCAIPAGKVLAIAVAATANNKAKS